MHPYTAAAMKRSGTLPPGYVYTGKRVATPQSYKQKPMVATEPTNLPPAFQAADSTIPMSVPQGHADFGNGIADRNGIRTADVVVGRGNVDQRNFVRSLTMPAVPAEPHHSAYRSTSMSTKKSFTYQGSRSAKKYKGKDLQASDGVTRLGQQRRSDWYADNHGNTESLYRPPAVPLLPRS